VAGDPVPVAPSPKSQLIAYGNVPPVVTAVNETGVFVIGLAGRKVKLVDNGGIVTTVTVAMVIAVLGIEDESVAVSVTVNDWAVAKV
jgi:hypothetical protein